MQVFRLVFFVSSFPLLLSLFLALFPVRFSLPFYVSIFLYRFPMVGICGPSSERICLWSPFEEVAINHHFFSFNNFLKHLTQEASRSNFFLFPHLLLIVMLICCGLKMDLVFIFNYLIFKILLKFMLKWIKLVMLQMLNLLICKHCKCWSFWCYSWWSWWCCYYYVFVIL